MPKKKTKNEFTKEELALRGIAFVDKKGQIKQLESECKELRGPLEDAVSTLGVETESGSKILVIPHADVDVHIKHTLRTGKVLLPEAIDVLKENGLDECVELVPTIREDVIERLYDEGKVTDEVLSKIYADKSSYAFSVELKERFDV